MGLPVAIPISSIEIATCPRSNVYLPYDVEDAAHPALFLCCLPITSFSGGEKIPVSWIFSYLVLRRNTIFQEMDSRILVYIYAFLVGFHMLCSEGEPSQAIFKSSRVHFSSRLPDSAAV